MTPGEAWGLIEQGLLPSERERACDEFRALLSRIWDEGYDAGRSEDEGGGRINHNPYERNEHA